MKNKIQTQTFCTTCNKQFSTRSTYNRHVREVHKIKWGLYVEVKDAVTKFFCVDCRLYFHNHMDLRFHLDEKHQTPWELDELEFNDRNEFKAWLLQEQASKKVQYVLSRGSSKTKQVYYECWKSATKNTCQPNSKGFISSKMKYACTSQIITKKDYDTSKVKVSYFKTHYGHSENDYLNNSSQVKPKKQKQKITLSNKLGAKSSSRKTKKRPSTLKPHFKSPKSKKTKKLSLSVIENSKSQQQVTEICSEILKETSENLECDVSENSLNSPDLTLETKKTVNRNQNLVSQIECRLQIISESITHDKYSCDQLEKMLTLVNAVLKQTQRVVDDALEDNDLSNNETTGIE